ncbi:MAG: adenosine kinase [Magnetococcales bacterium]|nr:adenosine kinase [Magnetococcales bacterium]NGZ27622.1 adenosine kinase [Magnetococcales bacterium]
MSRYHVYGLGHALLDVEYLVEDDFLTQAELTKGSMTLVNEEQQARLIAMTRSPAAKRSCGGSAANTIIGVAQLGGLACQAFRVAADEMGEFYRADMLANGVETASTPAKEGATGRCLVFITPDGERTMCTYLGVSEFFSPEDVQSQRIQDSQWLYIEGYLVTSPSAHEAALTAAGWARQAGVLRALTFSDVNMIHYFRDPMEKILALDMDLVFCNESEALAFTGQQDLSAAEKILQQTARMVCITRGAQGAIILTNMERVEVAAPQVKAINTNGAGDLFAGAFLYGITHGMELATAGKLACLASATLVTQPGARLQAEQTRGLLARLY